MSIQWKCVKCETTMISKCPVQRNIHCEGSIETRYIKSNTAAYVARVKDNHHEVFLNVSVYDSGSKTKIIRQALDWAGAKASEEDFNSAYCDHVWVIADPTIHECSLGCQHYNWSDRDKVLAELKEKEGPTTESLNHEISLAVNNDLTQYAKGLVQYIPESLKYNDKRDRYCTIMDGLRNLQYQVNNGMTKLRENRNVLPMYEVQAEGRQYSCDSVHELHAYCMGLKLQGIAFKLSKLRPGYSGYEWWEPSREELDLNLYCEACSIPLDDEVSFFEGKPYHSKCAAKKRDWQVVRHRKIVWRAPKDFDIYPSLSPDVLTRAIVERLGNWLGCYVYHVDPNHVRYARKYNHVVIQAECTLAQAEEIIERLNRN